MDDALDVVILLGFASVLLPFVVAERFYELFTWA